MFLLPFGGNRLGEMLTKNNGGTAESALTLGVVEFCQIIISAARKWLVDKKDDALVQSNLSEIMRVRPNGLPPHIVGTSLIA